MEPGSGGGVLTGQSVFFIPTLTAFTSSRLSLFVRPFTVGTVIGGSFDAESFPVAERVLDEVLPAVAGDESPVPDDGVPGTWATALEATPLAFDDPATRDPADADDATFWVSMGIDSPAGDGRASLLAAQAREAASAKDKISEIEPDL